MKNKSFWNNPILSLFLGVIVGLITSFNKDIKVTNSIIIGTFITVSIAIVQIQIIVKELQSTHDTILHVSKRLVSKNKFSGLLIKYGLNNLDKGFKKGFKLDRDDFFQIWPELLIKAGHSWKGLSHNNSWKDSISTYGSDVEEFRLQIRKEKFNIERVFIDTNENPEIKGIIDKQREIGVDIREINSTELLQIKDVNSKYKKVKTLDFAIVDDKLTLLVHIKRGEINYVEISFDRQTLKDCKVIFDEAFKNGTS